MVSVGRTVAVVLNSSSLEAGTYRPKNLKVVLESLKYMEQFICTTIKEVIALE